MTGIDLQVARIRARVSQTALAERLHVSHQRVSQVEGSLAPSPYWQRRYMQALTLLARRSESTKPVQRAA